MAAANVIAGKLDVPLIFRKGGGHAKASAKLVRRDGLKAGWRFAYIDGDPVLRAVLYESLRDPRNWPSILQLFRGLKSEEVLISLRENTVVTTEPGSDSYDESYAVEGPKVIVERVRRHHQPLKEGNTLAAAVAPGTHGITLAIPLPDREAARARERDKAALERLESSAAFHAPIREREP